MHFSVSKERLVDKDAVVVKRPKVVLPKPKLEPNLRSSYVFEIDVQRSARGKEEGPSVSLSSFK
jgi:hypothetical protein